MHISVLGHLPQNNAQKLGDLPQQQRRQQRLEGGMHKGTVDANRLRQIGVVVGAQGGQSLQVVTQLASNA